MELDILLRLVGLISMIFILSHPVNSQEKERYLRDFVKKKINVGSIKTFKDWFLSSLV